MAETWVFGARLVPRPNPRERSRDLQNAALLLGLRQAILTVSDHIRSTTANCVCWRVMSPGRGRSNMLFLILVHSQSTTQWSMSFEVYNVYIKKYSRTLLTFGEI